MALVDPTTQVMLGLMEGVLLKHFRIKSNDIKTWRFGDDMSPVSNANYNKIVNVVYTIVSDKLHENKRSGNKQKNGKIF